MEDAPNFLFVCLFQLGDLQSSYNAAKRAVDAFKEHVDSKELLKQLKHHFALLWYNNYEDFLALQLEINGYVAKREHS